MVDTQAEAGRTNWTGSPRVAEQRDPGPRPGPVSGPARRRAGASGAGPPSAPSWSRSGPTCGNRPTTTAEGEAPQGASPSLSRNVIELFQLDLGLRTAPGAHRASWPWHPSVLARFRTYSPPRRGWKRPHPQPFGPALTRQLSFRMFGCCRLRRSERIQAATRSVGRGDPAVPRSGHSERRARPDQSASTAAQVDV